MYDINLIKRSIVPDSRKKVILTVTSFSGLALALTLVAISTFSMANFRMSNVYAGEVERLEAAFTARYPAAPNRTELETMIRRTEPHLKEVGKLVDQRMTFTPIWEIVAQAVPEGVWLTRLSIADPRTNEDDTRAHGKPRTYSGIVIEGVALAGTGPEGDQAVSQFVENLENDVSLRAYVTGVESMGTGLQQVSGTSVVGFEITCPF